MPPLHGTTARSSSRSSKSDVAVLAPPHHVVIGEVTGAHGIHGLLRVRSHNEASDLLATLDQLDLLHPDGRIETHTIRRASPHQRGLWLVGVEDVDDRTAAEALARCRVVVDETRLPRLDPDEFYHHEIVGFDVETTDGTRVGRVTGTMSTGLNDVWIVEDGDREHLIPVVADVVASIDRSERRVVIVPLDGLLD